MLGCLLMLSAMGLHASAYPMTKDVMIYHTETELGDGLTYETMYTEQDGVSQKGYLFTYRPGNGVLPIVTYGTHIVGRETTSSMMQLEQKALSADGVRVIGGMNADFFSMQTGIPMGVIIKDGEILSTDAGSGAIGIRENGTFLVGNPSITVTMQRMTDNGAAALTLPIAHVNKYPAVWGAYLCTPAHGKTKGPAFRPDLFAYLFLWRCAFMRLSYLCFDIFLRLFFLMDPMGFSPSLLGPGS